MPIDKDDDDVKKEPGPDTSDVNGPADGNQGDPAHPSSSREPQAQDASLPVTCIGASSPCGETCLIPNNVIEGVKKLIGEVQVEITAILTDIDDKTTKIVNEIERSIREIELLQHTAVTGMVDEATAYLDSVEDTGRQTKKCVDEHRSQIDAIKIIAKSQADYCIAEANEKRLKIPNHIQGHKLRIQDNLNRLETTLKECNDLSANFSEFASCVGVRATIIQTEVYNILKEIGGVFVECSKQGFTIVAEVQSCLGKVVQEANNHLHDLTTSINRCISSSASADTT